MKTILVTGGLGYIGSHTIVSLLAKNYKVLILDSNVNSSKNNLVKIKKTLKQLKISFENRISFVKGDVRDATLLADIFSRKNLIDGVIHFAGYKSIEKSFIDPLSYWDNNVYGSIKLLEAMQRSDFCRTLIFSSSATVYSSLSTGSLKEDYLIKPISPYGKTKASVEYFLNDIFSSSSDEWRISCLRYFNPIGAHSSGLIGENLQCKPTNIFPLILKSAFGEINKLFIFGDNWPTPDGTCIRDYIHVEDVAEGHVAVLENMFRKEKGVFLKLNIGTGMGTSVLELIDKFKSVNKVNINYEFVDRREGDIPRLVADNSNIFSMIGWKPRRKLDDMCKDGFKWYSNLKN